MADDIELWKGGPKVTLAGVLTQNPMANSLIDTGQRGDIQGFAKDVSVDPIASAKGFATTAATIAPDMLGMAAQGVNALKGATPHGRLPLDSNPQPRRGIPDLPVTSGDPIRESVGLDPENLWGIGGEMVFPFGTAAKGTALAATTLGIVKKAKGGTNALRIKRKYPLASKDNWHADADFEARGGKVVEMTPDEFLDNASPLKMDELARENIDDLKKHINDGGELDPLTLYGDKTKTRNSDGRHRAIAAKELGMDTVPVLDLRKQSPTNALMTTHNLTAENVLKSEELGGIPMPSIGIVNPKHPLTGYGEITLVGDQRLAKPAARNPVYPADAYSPRQPRADTIYSSGEKDKINSLIGSVADQDQAWRLPTDANGRHYVYYEGDPKEGLSVMLERNDYGKALFLKERGQMPPMTGDSFEWNAKVRELTEGMQDEFIAWTKSKPQELGISGKQMIRTGWNDLGHPTYRAETMQNVLREMRREMAGADGSAGLYGAGHLRAGVTPKFRNITEIKNARAQIKSTADLTDYKDSMNNQLLELVDDVSKYSDYTDPNPFIANDVNLARLEEVIKGQSPWDEYFPGAPDELKVKVNKYLDELRNGATEYFEAKPMRGVGLDEFKVALIPENADPKIRGILEGKGLKVDVYDGTEKGRKAALQKHTDLMWSAAVGAFGLGVGSQVTNALNNDGT